MNNNINLNNINTVTSFFREDLHKKKNALNNLYGIFGRQISKKKQLIIYSLVWIILVLAAVVGNITTFQLWLLIVFTIALIIRWISYSLQSKL